MSFIVTWDEAIAGDIDEAMASTNAPRASAIAEAVEQLHEELVKDALNLGESRQAGLVRVATEPPVTIHFRVTDRLNRARVFAVAIHGR